MSTNEDDHAVVSGPADQMMNNNNNNESESDRLKDKYCMGYILFYALGTLTLVPSNFFTTANDYWMYKFRDPDVEYISENTNENRTTLQAQFTSNYNIVANVCNVLFLIITVAISRKVSILKRLIFALCATIILFAITVIFVEINTDTWQQGFFAITLITGGLLACTGSVFMVTLFQLISRFPQGYITAILSGQSICGIFAALVQIFSLSIGASSQTNGLVYFLIGMFFVFSTLVYFVITLYKSEFFIYHLNKKVEEVSRPKIQKKELFEVLNVIKFYLLSMVIVLGSSVMVHPAVTSLVQSEYKGNSNKWNDSFFVPVCTFLSYNIFDWIGREVAGKLQKPSNDVVIFIIGIVRISFVPMFMFCNAQPRHHLPVAFSDWTYILLIIIFGLSNGFLVNLCVIKIPTVTTPEQKNLGMVFVVVTMILGLGICSLLGAVLVNAL